MPPEGYIVLPSQTYQGFALLRSIVKSDSAEDIAKAVAYGKQIKLYPLSQAASPPQTVFVDMINAVFAGGRAGYDPGLRAALAKYEVGAQLSDQVICPNTSVDDKGEQLTGAHKYVLHFDVGKLPPVATFWNLAMYGSDMLFVENDFGRYSFGSTTDGLKKSSDGSLTIVIQKDRPSDTSNWLPAPAGNFNMTMRFYGPETPVLDGSYRVPAVKRVQ
jgi:hypothetical protein